MLEYPAWYPTNTLRGPFIVERAPASSPNITSVVLSLNALNDPDIVNDPVIETSPVALAPAVTTCANVGVDAAGKFVNCEPSPTK